MDLLLIRPFWFSALQLLWCFVGLVDISEWQPRHCYGDATHGTLSESRSANIVLHQPCSYRHSFSKYDTQEEKIYKNSITQSFRLKLETPSVIMFFFVPLFLSVQNSYSFPVNFHFVCAPASL